MESDERKAKAKEDLCIYLREGMYKKDAAKLVGISEDTYLRWYKEDADFAGRVEANILEYKRSLIKAVNVHAEKNGLLALKLLQTRWPNDSKEWDREEREGWDREEREGWESDTKRLADTLQALFDKEDGIEEELTTQEN